MTALEIILGTTTIVATITAVAQYCHRTALEATIRTYVRVDADLWANEQKMDKWMEKIYEPTNAITGCVTPFDAHIIQETAP